MVIYCDSRHAEFETCCDISPGPVSLNFGHSLQMCLRTYPYDNGSLLYLWMEELHLTEIHEQTSHHFRENIASPPFTTMVWFGISIISLSS